MKGVKMIDENNNSKHKGRKRQEWLCSKCRHPLAELISPSEILFYGKGKEEFRVSFDEIEIECPYCGSRENIDSHLLDDALKVVSRYWGEEDVEKDHKWNLKMQIRSEAILTPDDFLGLAERQRLTPKQSDRFTNTLSERRRKVFKILRGNDYDPTGEVWKRVRDKLGLDQLEALIEISDVDILLRKFHSILVVEKLQQKEFSVEDIKSIYGDPVRYENIMKEAVAYCVANQSVNKKEAKNESLRSLTMSIKKVLAESELRLARIVLEGERRMEELKKNKRELLSTVSTKGS